MNPTLARCRVSASRERGYRSVRVAVGYVNFDHRAIFERFANWHGGEAPVPATSTPIGIEVATFASGRKPETLALYTTRYRDERSLADTRGCVDTRVREGGWGYIEPRPGIMFLRDGSFEAELHVGRDSDGSTVAFVGEFQLR